ncbi:MAG TPA: YhbY family RNA-binding protein [Thermofilaceae archaeon]|nr:YhbY family RNA-binding protein [Thermofilaceae archaeon]
MSTALSNSAVSLVVVRVGKRGITDALIRELDNILKARGVVKVKLLRSFRESYDVDREVRARLAEELAERLRAEVIDVRGYTIVLKRGRGITG